MPFLFDDFTTGQESSSVPPASIETHFQAGSMMGGFRSTKLHNALSPKGTSARLDVAGEGRLRLTLDAEQYARLDVTYGIRPDGTVADLGLNLHEGDVDRFQITMSHLADTVVNLNVTIGTPVGWTSAGMNAREGQTDVLFSEFAGPAGQDFTHVSYIVFVFTVRGSLTLDSVGTRHVPTAHEAKFSGQITSGGLAALGGSVEVTIHDDGTSEWWGHAHDSGADGYDFGVSAILGNNGGKVIAFAHHGHVGGTFTPGPRNHDWDDHYPVQSVLAERFPEFATGDFQHSTAYSSDIGSALESAISVIARFLIGATPVGAVAGLVIFVGVEIGSLISTGSLVPGARVVEGVLWLAGPSNMLLALAAEGIASAGSRTRELSDDEYNWANTAVFEGTLPPKSKIVLTDTIGPGSHAFTFPRFDGKITLNMGPDTFDDPRRYGMSHGSLHGEVFIHELTHAWQIEHTPDDLALLADALASKICKAAGGDPYLYGVAGPPYGDFNLEQQASIVADWFCGRSGSGAPKDTSNPYFRYIQQNIRTGQY